MEDVYAMFQEYIKGWTNGHWEHCHCDFCLASITLFADESGELCMGKRVFTWGDQQEAVALFNGLL